jgi:hypothetical protein
MGDANTDATAWFNDAVANANKIALSFGGDGWWAFGCGVNGGPANPGYATPVSDPLHPVGTAHATFLLYNFAAK